MSKPRRSVVLTRERILAESAEVFNRRGHRGTTLDGIARRLGVTKAALYYHVKNKEELSYLCHQASLEIGVEGIRQARTRGRSPDEQLRIAVAYYIEEMSDQLRGTVALLEEGALSPRHHRRIIALRDEYEAMLRSLIAEGVASGVFVPCDPKLVGFAILGAMNWIPKWYNADGKYSGKQIAEAFAAYMVRGILANPGSESIPLEPS